jgi:hypothetical protein
VDGKVIPCRGYRCAGNADIEAPFYYLADKDPHSLSQCRGKIVLVDGYLGYWIYQDLLENGAVGFITYDGHINYADRDMDDRELRSYVHNGNRIPGVNINVNDAVALVEQGAIAIGHNDAEQTWTLGRLLNYYSNRLSGYILCSMDTTSESAEVAINLAHYLNAVVVTPENEEVAQAAGLSLVADVTDKDDAWLRATPYFEKMSKTLAVEPDIAQSVAFVDYVVMSGCYYHDYREGDEYMHVQSFKHLDTGAYLLTLPGDDEHHTITFEAIGLVVLTPDQTLWANLSLLMAADPVKVEEALTIKK